MLAAREPWKDQSLVAVAFRVSQGQRLPLDTLGPERCPPKLRRLIESLWDHDPLRRPAVRPRAWPVCVCVWRGGVGREQRRGGGAAV